VEEAGGAPMSRETLYGEKPDRRSGIQVILKIITCRLNHYTHSLLLESTAGIVTRGIRHLIAGGIGTFLYVVFIAVFVEIFIFHPVTGATLSYILIDIYSYVVYRVWVYNSQNGHRRGIPRYIIASCISLSLNAGIMYVVAEMFDLWYGFGVAGSVVVLPLTNFLLNYYWTYR
jgi:putative flippase GtrA